MKNLKVLPLNFKHGIKASEFGKILFEHRKIGKLKASNRVIIPNDAKMFAQADTEENISHFVTSDTESLKLYTIIKKNLTPQFEIIDINIPHTEYFGLLNL